MATNIIEKKAKVIIKHNNDLVLFLSDERSPPTKPEEIKITKT